MEIVRFADLVATPWKNGGGVTREVLREDRDGEIAWRLSIADVASEGPFSVFPGLQRILTVIEGDGMRLVRSDGSFLAADRLEPVFFGGEEPITGMLPRGPCRDFNVIWNPALAQASVAVIDHRDRVTPEHGALVGVLSPNPIVSFSSGEQLAPGDFAIVRAPVTLVGRRALLVVIRNTSHP